MITFARYFKPACVVTIAALVLTNIDGEGLRVAFTVDRTMTREPDTARVVVYNLGEAERQAAGRLFAETGRTKVTLAAGYDGVTIPLFAGDVRKLRTDRRAGPDRMTEIQADDSGDAISDVIFAEVPGAGAGAKITTTGMTAQNMIDAALAAFATYGEPIVAHPSVAAAIAAVAPAATQTFAVVHVGKATELIDQAARVLDVRWWIADGQLFMARRGLPTDPQLSIVLDADRLLAEPDSDGSGLWRITSLFDPNILPGRQIVVNGIPMRVEATQHGGDTRASGAPWSVACTAREFAA